jgi:hypothetical protein
MELVHGWWIDLGANDNIFFRLTFAVALEMIGLHALGKLEYWYIGVLAAICLSEFHHSIIPSFHHSIIPLLPESRFVSFYHGSSR